ncbi:MAG TPA: alpha/beta fold hydrolase [Chitinophagaceae bacterium]|nr:alpha/beta fold hydrolase [Chitinophagaceae bacterium]
MDTINLYCLPFSGGSKYSYKAFSQYAPPFLNIIPLEIPGRGSRSGEELLTDIELTADDVFDQIKNGLDKPYAIYGHSMGGILAYLLARRIIDAGLDQPLHLFVTGCVAPSLKYRDLVDHTLPKEEFLQKIKDLGGSPDSVLSNPALMEFFEPILRADFEAVATYKHIPAAPFSIPVSAVLGDAENATIEEAMQWQKETTATVDVKTLPGNHFFIFEHPDYIIQMISRKLQLQHA